MSDDQVKSRNKARRQMTQGSMLLVFAIVIAAIWCLSSDPLAERLLKLSAFFEFLLAALLVQIGHYIWTGSSETKKAMDTAPATA